MTMLMIPRLKECGIISIVDSDGDITVPAGWFESERVLELVQQYGQY